jgi:hypothetical protein
MVTAAETASKSGDIKSHEEESKVSSDLATTDGDDMEEVRD